MKTAKYLGARCSAFSIAAVVAVGLTLGLAPRPARAQACAAGDCDGSGEVTVDEIIILVNITLGTAQPSACPNGIPPGRDVDITLIVQAVGLALNGCTTTTTTCGNGTVEPPETCDDGGTCTGGTNAGTHCTAETDCQGNGICEGGTKVYFACADDTGCPGGKCIHCKTFGGDGCAANCTTETDVVMTLEPGVTVGLGMKPGTSGAVIHSDILTIPLPLTGTQTVTIGQKGPDGNVTGVIKANSIQFPRIPVSSIACACLRGVAAKTCGGTLYNIDGVTPSTDCTADFTAGDSVCPANLPCSFLHGPGSAASGTIGCGPNGYSPTDALYFLDSGGATGTPGNPIITLSGSGPTGSALILSNNAIGTVSGLCKGTDTSKYGADGEFCTDDDPQDVRGDPSPQLNLTGTATGQIAGANGVDGNDLDPSSSCKAAGDPMACCTAAGTGTCTGFSTVGTVVNCDALLGPSHSIVGANLAGSFVSLNQPTTGDIVVTSNLVGGAATGGN